MDINEKEIRTLLNMFPKKRNSLPEEYQRIYERHYSENRNATTNASRATAIMESWCHRHVAKTVDVIRNGGTLEIGAGTLNQFQFEKKMVRYDIVEPYTSLYANSKYKSLVDHAYLDICDIPQFEKYDRIISLFSFEHILNLPEVIQKAASLLAEGGVLSVGIPNEGRFLWRFAYRNTTGREFKHRYGLNYEVMMHYEHVNTADEIEILLRYYFNKVNMKLFGFGRELAFYRYFCCSNPILIRCR